MLKEFSGLFTALVTPFKQDLSIDYIALQGLIEKQEQNKVDGLVINGTSAESPVINQEETTKIIKLAVNTTSNKTKIIVGTGSNDTATTLENSKIAEDIGADGLLLVTPYYNKPSQDGLYKHFITIAEATNIPILLYNIAGRTGVNLETSTLVKLSKHSNIVGVKEASGDMFQIMDVISSVDKEFVVLSGDDALTYNIMNLGGHGVVSVISNILPKDMKEFTNFLSSGNQNLARVIHYKLYPLMKALISTTTNPVPIKTLLAHYGEINEVFRLPLTNMTAQQSRELINIYQKIINA